MRGVEGEGLRQESLIRNETRTRALERSDRPYFIVGRSDRKTEFGRDTDYHLDSLDVVQIYLHRIALSSQFKACLPALALSPTASARSLNDQTLRGLDFHRAGGRKRCLLSR